MIRVERYLDDYQVDEERVSLGRTITETDVVVHAGQSGDFFPHHMDLEWSKAQEFGQRIAHGTLVLTIAVGMTASEVNPHAFSYGYDRVRFVRPVFLQDTITSTARITAIRPHPTKVDWGFVEEGCTVVNQHDVVVLGFVHLYLVKVRPKSDGHSPGDLIGVV